MAMKTVWGVAIGSYSDYAILYICDTEERATAVAAALNAKANKYNEAYVEEFSYIDNEFASGTLLTMNAYLKPDGTVISGVNQSEGWVGEAGTSAYSVTLARIGSNTLRLSVAGTDHERVNKAFSERLTQLVADAAYR